MPFVNFWKKFRLASFDFRQNFEVRTIQRWLSNEHTRNQKFFERYPKIFFPKIITMVLLDGFLNGFPKFWFFIGEICILIRDFWVIFENYSMRMLSIRGNDFIACWAYAEQIFAYAQHARKFRQFLHGHLNACWADGETISSHAEHTGKGFHRMLSIRGKDFIARWAYAEMI